MAALTYAVSTLLMGIFLVAIGVALARGMEWRRYSLPGGGDSTSKALRRAARNPIAWTAGFLFLAFGSAAGAVLYVTDSGVSKTVTAGAGMVVAAVIAIALGLYFFWGVYHSSRYRGLKSAQAAALTGWIFGLVLIVAIVLKLVTAS